MQERVLLNPKINILRNTEATEILGDGKVMTMVVVHHNQSNAQQQIEAWGLFYAIGHKPNTEFLWWQIDLDDTWYIKVIPGTVKTNVDGVFAAGDVQDKQYRQAITSAGTGCMAAMDAEKWLVVHE